MGKALVIKNVNFADNALDVVTLQEDIPCTGITLDATKQVDDLSPFTLTATVTPSTTTDVIVWSSSNNAVATVDGNGVVTPIKSGNVTITATCGSQSASCAVTISAYIDPLLLFGHYLSKNESAGTLQTLTIDGAADNTTSGFTCNVTGTGKYVRDPSSFLSGEHAYPIMLPDGCTALRITVPNQSMKASVCWCDSTATSDFGANYIKATEYEASPWASSISAGDRTVNVPESVTADCFYINIYLANNLSQELLDQVTVEALFE